MSKGGRRDRRQGHKQALGDQIEDPASHGVRVRVADSCSAPRAPRRGFGLHAPSPSHQSQSHDHPTTHTTTTQAHPRGSSKKRQRGGGGGDGGDDQNDDDHDQRTAANDPAAARRDALAAQRTSARILREARLQQEEVDLEHEGDHAAGADADAVDHRALTAAVARATTRPRVAGRAAAAAAAADSSDEDDDDGDGDDGNRPGLGTDAYDDDDERLVAAGGGGYEYGGADVADEVTPEEEAALRAFMGQGAAAAGPEGLWGAPAEAGKPTRDLAGLVMERLREKQQQQQQQQEEAEQRREEDAAEAGDRKGATKKAKAAAPATTTPAELDERVAEVYRGVGQLLKRYTSGPLPKALKVVPSLRSWEQALALADPPGWSPHAHYACARLFISNLSDRTAPRYLRTVLLPAVREDIRAHGRLHFALFQALRKSTYKPGAFFKGVLLPLCSGEAGGAPVGGGRGNGNPCSLREAVILSSVLKRASLPALHSAAALLRLSKLPYCGTTSFFVRVLLDKRYALPYAVVDALAEHFAAFSDDDRLMPVVWHQCLLCFVQRYKDELSSKDAARLRHLCERQCHYAVTPEVLRELDAADAAAAAAAAVGGGAGAAAAGGGGAGARRRGGAGAAAAAATGGASASAEGQPASAAAKVVALVGSGAAAREDPRDLPPVFMGEDE
jgi:essential nuclear protein 1